jgi:transposase
MIFHIYSWVSTLLQTPNPLMKSLTKSQTTRVIELLHSGLSGHQINKDTGIGLASISRIRNKHCPDLDKSSGGRPSKLTTANINYTKRAMHMGKISNATEAAQTLQNITNMSVTPQTVRRNLRSTGWKAVKKRKRPALKPGHMRARKEFAERHLHWTVDDWKRVIWSDETKINRLGSDGQQWVWKEAGEGLNARLVQQTTKYGGGHVMVWGCMTWHGVGFAARIEGNMDADLYTRILDDDLLNTIKWYKLKPENLKFQQDNDSKHTSKKAREWFEDNDIDVLIWPANSPDMNPIEHLWVHIKNELKKFEHPPSGVLELWERVEKLWDDIPPEVCQNLIESMPRRIQAVAKAKGAWTKY